ncbi:MAG TPA: cupin domain-containing protein [Candidatus Eisenbacteria bacterium]|nr:cupin domain-containing protein [Candidatus Eisenbacteria bacterium]
MTIRAKDFPGQKGPAERFVGDVVLQNLSQSKNVDVTVYRVTFEKGAHTNWHTHSQGQVLYFLEGKGRVQIEGEDIINAVVGDVVEIPANARHWHGAHPEEQNHMCHLAITYGEIEWMEPVDNSIYTSS